MVVTAWKQLGISDPAGSADLMLPGMDGFEVCRILRQEYEYPHPDLDCPR